MVRTYATFVIFIYLLFQKYFDYKLYYEMDYINGLLCMFQLDYILYITFV